MIAWCTKCSSWIGALGHRDRGPRGQARVTIVLAEHPAGDAPCAGGGREVVVYRSSPVAMPDARSLA